MCSIICIFHVQNGCSSFNWSLLICFILDSDEDKPQKVFLKPSLLSDVAKNLANASPKSKSG